MAIFNEILEGRYNRALQKLFAIKGSPPVRQLGGELMPVMALFYGVEARFLESWNRFGNTLIAPAVAAQNSAVRMRNPAGSNVVAVVEKLTVTNGLADVVTLSNQVSDTDLATPGGSIRLDFRQSPGSNISLSLGNNIAGGSNFAGSGVQANIAYDFIAFEEQELTILPGDQLDIRNVVVNNALRVSMIWRERLLTESERK
jgi:hypothetical protein